MPSCPCLGKAIYALQCAQINTDIFVRFDCSVHSGSRKTVSGSSYVTCYISPDVAISGCEPLDSWPTTFHGTTVEVVRSVLVHGMLMKVGDILHDGTIIKSRCATAGQESAIWTYPTQEGAEKAAGLAAYDQGGTEFKVIIRLRQKPGTYTVHRGKGFGYDVWSTERRGTQYIEGLDVLVVKAKCSRSPLPSTMVVSPKNYVKSFKCQVQQNAFEVLERLKMPQSMFDGKHNRCYCSTCYPAHWKSSMVVANETYAIPRGWIRFGLLVNPVTAHINDIWKSWQIAFHGCHPMNVVSIIKNRSLLIPHDVLPDGTKLQVWSSADKNQKCYFLSPAIGYSAHPWYAKPIPFVASDGRRKYFQTVLVFKVRPGSYSKKDETEDGEMKMFDDYSIIAEDEVEWFSSRRGCTHPYGLLIRIIDACDLKELNKWFDLAADSPFRQTYEFSMD